MTDVQALKTELAEKQKAMQAAQASADIAKDAYQKEFAIWLTAHSDIAVADDLAEETAKRAKSEFTETRKRIADELSAHFAENSEAAKLEACFGMRLSAEPVYEDDIEFVRAVAESGMLFMLQPDTKAITKYIKGMSDKKTKTLMVGVQEEEITLYVLPQRVYDCLPALGITTVTKATISDDKLQD